jgi:hypothetical protein
MRGCLELRRRKSRKSWAHDATVYNCYLTSIKLIQLKKAKRAGNILRIQMRFVSIRGNFEHDINIYLEL